MKLLIADDSPIIRKVVKAAADGLQMETIEAQNGIEALEKLSVFYKETGLILLDWHMPEMNGYDALVAIKGNDQYKAIPVMMLTAEGQKSNIIAAIRAGADNYQIKPFTPDELKSKIAECIGRE